MKNISLFLIALILFISTKSTAQGTPQQLKDFDAYVEKSLFETFSRITVVWAMLISFGAILTLILMIF